VTIKTPANGDDAEVNFLRASIDLPAGAHVECGVLQIVGINLQILLQVIGRRIGTASQSIQLS